MTLPTDGNAPLNNPSHLTEHQRVSDALALLVTTPWIALAFQTGWSNFVGTTFEQGAYRKVGDMVQLQGLVSGPAGISTVAFLPVGYRPKRQQLGILGSAQTTNNARIDVMIDGTIQANLTAAGWLAFTGFMFATTGL